MCWSIALVVQHMCLLSWHDLVRDIRPCSLVMLACGPLPDWSSVSAACVIDTTEHCSLMWFMLLRFRPFYGCCKHAIAQLLLSMQCSTADTDTLS